MRRTILVSALLVAVVPGLNPTRAQDANSAKTFLVEAYQHYGKNGKGIDFGGPSAHRYYHSSLIALMRADAKANGPDNVGVLDSDPLCSCQDWDGIFELKIDLQLEAPGRAQAEASFALDDVPHRNRDSWRKLKIQLRAEHGAWRIYDVLDVSPGQPPFDVRNALIRDIQSIQQSSKGKMAKP